MISTDNHFFLKYDQILYYLGELCPFSNLEYKCTWSTQFSVPLGTLEIVIQEVLWSIRGSYSAIRSLPLTTSQLIRLSTYFGSLIPSLIFTELRVVSMEPLQRVYMPSGNAYNHMFPSGYLFAPLFWDLLMIVETSFPELAVSFLDYPSAHSLYWARILCTTLFFELQSKFQHIESILMSYPLFWNTQLSALFIYMLWHIELKFCMWNQVWVPSVCITFCKS